MRVDFNGRSVRGWVTGEATRQRRPQAPDEVARLRSAAVAARAVGAGPSERWYSPLSRLLVSTSPKRLITDTADAARRAVALAPSVMAGVHEVEPGVLEVAPTTDPLALILAAYETTREKEGSLLVLVPTESWAGRLRGRLEQRGCAVASGEDQWDRMRAGWPVVVGARGTALAPVPQGLRRGDHRRRRRGLPQRSARPRGTP